MKKIVLLVLLPFFSFAETCTSKAKVGVEGMVCGNCEEKITKAFKDSAKNIQVDLKGKSVALEYAGSGLNEQAISKTITEQGYKVTDYNEEKVCI